MYGYLAFAYGVVGLVIGSFLNVVIDRVPLGKSLLRPPSHCPFCGRKLSPLELVPVLSYLALGGRCRTCGASIPVRVPIVEGLTGLLFTFLYGIYGATPQLLLVTVYTCVLLAVTFIDLEHMLIPNVIILPAVVFALLTIPFQPLPSGSRSGGVLLRLLQNARAHSGLSLLELNGLSHLAGGMAGFLIVLSIWFVSLRLVGVDAIGFGDVKLAAFCGLIVAFPGILVVVLGSFILAGLGGVLLLTAGVVDRKTPVPFAPFLVAATFIFMVWTESLLGLFV
ncbi:MAG: prepilin peptidase [Chloroflexota bacterium]|nr:prepilin peptidase [Chloroflexota bacterium]